MNTLLFWKDRVVFYERETSEVPDTMAEGSKSEVQLFGTLEDTSLLTRNFHLPDFVCQNLFWFSDLEELAPSEYDYFNFIIKKFV